MKLRVGDQVLVTAGKDKGKQGKITRVFPKLESVIVEGANTYVKHVKPQGERAGEKVRRERALSMGKVAILNEKGERDRVGIRVTASGEKERFFKKTGTVITDAVKATANKASKKAEKSEKKVIAEKTDKPKKQTKTKKA